MTINDSHDLLRAVVLSAWDDAPTRIKSLDAIGTYAEARQRVEDQYSQSLFAAIALLSAQLQVEIESNVTKEESDE